MEISAQVIDQTVAPLGGMLLVGAAFMLMLRWMLGAMSDQLREQKNAIHAMTIAVLALQQEILHLRLLPGDGAGASEETVKVYKEIMEHIKNATESIQNKIDGK